ncbi:MAG: hypothetical protein R2827_09185 [Bdellovibrionales bacterium]
MGAGRALRWRTSDQFASGVPKAASFLSYGTVGHQTGAYEVDLTEVDFRNTEPTLNSIEPIDTIPAGSSITLEWAGYETSGDTTLTYTNVTSLTNTSLPRYGRLKATINNGSATDPVLLTGFTIDITDLESEEFEFVGACGSTKSTNVPPAWVLILLPLLIAMVLRKQSVPVELK